VVFVILIVNAAFEVYFWLIIAHVIFSWIPVRQVWLMDLRDFVDRLVEPYLSIFRRMIPIIQLGGGGLDISPIVAIMLLRFAQPIVVNILAGTL
jgi:YggT family protein